MKLERVYISVTEDCGENEGGFYCQVYSDKDCENQIDDFCIHPEDCDCKDEAKVERFIHEYTRQYIQRRDCDEL